MSKRASFTVLSTKRLITAFEQKGYRIAGAKADGTILVYTGDERPAELSIVPDQPKRGTSWDDV